MQQASRGLERWSSIVGHVCSLIDLEASARTHRALLRRRGVRSAGDLLHLAFLYGPGGLSLRGVASFATEAGIADLCDVSLLDRLRNSGDYLAEVLDRLLANSRGDAPTDGRLQLNLVDGSTVSLPGSNGSDWRLHARYEPARGRFTDLAITEATTAEALCCVAVRPGDVLVQDRGYARVRNFAHARANGADFITRIGWRSVRLYNSVGHSFDLLAALPESGAPVVEHQVQIGSGRAAVPARLIIARKPAEAIERQHQRLRRKASRKGHKIDPRTLRTAGFMMLLTSLAPDQATAEEVVRLYRMRWQVELAFKRLKSLGGFAKLQASDPRLARTWLLAHLIAAVLIETSLSEDLDSPPLSRTIPPRHASRVSGVPGRQRISVCYAPSSPGLADASAQPPAPPQEGAATNHRDEDDLKQTTLNMLYPSAHGALPLALLPSRR
jgi:hypothetical protein